MKSVLLLLIATTTAVFSFAQQDKSKRPSPPAQAKETLKSGAVVSIDYGQPSVKGRTIGKDLEPMDGKVWRAGANEATAFETSKDIIVEGKPLPAGKYALFTLSTGDDWTIIFNKTPGQWGAFKYNEADDVLRVKARASKNAAFAEKLTYTINKEGNVALLWGDRKVEFTIL